MDKSYLEALAKAHYSSKDGWAFDEGVSSAYRRAQVRMQSYASHLQELFDDALMVYNGVATKPKQIHLWPLHTAEQGRGFMLLLGRAQLKLLQSGHGLEVSLTVLEDYAPKESFRVHLQADVSPLGLCEWQNPGSGQTFNDEALIRFALELLVKSQCMESGYL